MSAGLLAASSVATLTNLDGYMAAAGYGTDHPWRLEIGAALAGSNAPDIVVRAPYGEMHISTLGADDQIEMRANQLAKILRLMPIASYSLPMVHLVRQLADDLVAALRNGESGALLAGQLSELLLMMQGENGPCDLLWLCQQIADEMDAVMAAVLREVVTS